MCCRRKKKEYQPIKNRHNPAESFPLLIESLQVEARSTEELQNMKNELLARPEWKNSTLKNISLLQKETNTVCNEIIKNITTLSDGLHALLLINKKLEDTLISKNE